MLYYILMSCDIMLFTLCYRPIRCFCSIVSQARAQALCMAAHAGPRQLTAAQALLALQNLPENESGDDSVQSDAGDEVANTNDSDYDVENDIGVESWFDIKQS